MRINTHHRFQYTLSTAYFSMALCLALLIGLLPIHSQAQSNSQVAEVRSAVDGLYQALSNNDANGFSIYLPPQGFTEINPDWNGIRRLDMNVFNNIFNSGAKINLSVADVQIYAIDDKTALVTGYRVGTITPPGGAAIASRLALSMIWSNHLGKWKLQHVHLSEEKA